MAFKKMDKKGSKGKDRKQAFAEMLSKKSSASDDDGDEEMDVPAKKKAKGKLNAGPTSNFMSKFGK